jgi:hypothetical protein
MTNAFEYGDALLPQSKGETDGDEPAAKLDSNQPYLNLATYGFLPMSMNRKSFTYDQVPDGGLSR